MEECKGSFQGDSVSPNRISAAGVRITSLRIAALAGELSASQWMQARLWGCRLLLGNWGAPNLGISATTALRCPECCLGQLLDSIGDIKSLITKVSPLLRHGSSTLSKVVSCCIYLSRLTCRPWIKLSTATIATLDTPRLTISPSLGNHKNLVGPPFGSLSNLNTTLSEDALQLQVGIQNLQQSSRKQNRVSYFFRNYEPSPLFFHLFTAPSASTRKRISHTRVSTASTSLNHHGPNNGKAHRRRAGPDARQPHQANQLLHRAFPSLLQVQRGRFIPRPVLRQARMHPPVLHRLPPAGLARQGGH